MTEAPETLVARALDLHRAGELQAAEPLYRAVLAVRPDHFGALHLLGLLRAMSGDPAGALPLLHRAIGIDPDQGFVHSNLGNALVELDRPREALEAFDRAILLSPGLVEARIGRGNALQALDRTGEAILALDAAAALGADMPELHNNRGNALRALHRPEAALDSYDAAIARNALYAAAHANRATALADLNREVEALASIGIALLLRQDDPGFLTTQGVILRSMGRPEDALRSFDHAIALSPDLAAARIAAAAALCDLGRHDEALALADAAIALSGDAAHHRGRAAALSRLGRHDEAEAADHEALRQDPDCAEAWNGRGNALVELERCEEAMACFDRAETLRPGNRNIPYNRGNALRGMNRHREAVACFRAAQAIDPDFADAAWNESLSLLALGEREEGYARYEARWRRKGHRPHRHAAAPLWRGEAMEGRTLLLHAEQGLGDTIQMARYIPLAAACGARIVLEAQAPLLPLLRDLPGVAELLSPSDPTPPHDAQCPLMSLPLAFGGATPPPRPFTVHPDKAAAWAATLSRESGGHRAIRIGIACSGNPSHKADRHRSVPLALFKPLLGPGVRGFLIQTELRPADEATLLATPALTDLRPLLTDFTETAAALLALDAVVCVDTSIAHLAAAMGRPVHMLVPTLADWRWGLGRDSTPWYPGMTLHRRGQDEPWEAVIARIGAALPRPGAYPLAWESGVATSSSDRPSAAKPSFHSVAAAPSISAAPIR